LKFITMLAMIGTLSACGGGFDTEATPSVGASEVAWPLLDDEGGFMPSLPQAVPAAPGERTRAGRYAIASQARDLETALGPRALRIDLDTSGGRAATLAMARVPSARALAGLRDDVPVLIYGRDRPWVAAVAESLAEAGLTGVWVVTT
jgi:hypothetical protein